MSHKLIVCPTCKEGNKEKVWNENTVDVVRGLNDDDDFPITYYAEREEGVFFRCPNPSCEDEVITDENGVLRQQDDEGNPIRMK